MSIILFVNLKGGVAKTTNAVAVAECLAAEKGLKTLVIDADHQCAASELLVGESRLLKYERQWSLHDMLGAMLDDEFEAEQVQNYIVPNVSNIGGGLENLSVMPCSIRIDDFQTNMAKAKRGFKTNDEFLSILNKRKAAVRRWLTKNFHFTIIDCPPSIPLQVRLFLTMADSYIVPCVPDRLSVRGALWLKDRLRRLNVKIPPLGTLWTLYRQQNKVHRDVIAATKDNAESYGKLAKPFATVIPNAAAIAEANESLTAAKSFNAKYTSEFAKLYRSLSQEIIQRSQWGSEVSEKVGHAPAEALASA
ncbi:MAG: ParA family protein [Thermoguttaceae bacterium]